MSKELKLQDMTASKKAIINEEQFNFLFKRTPQSSIYERKAKGGGTWKYVTGSYVKKVLNFISGFNWDFEIVEDKVMIEYKQVIVKGRLKIRLDGQEVIKMQYGRADIKLKKSDQLPLDLGNDLKAAATDCLKKCASELGVAADVYGANEFREVKVKVEKKSQEEMDWEKTQQRIKEHIEGSVDVDELMMVMSEVDQYDLREEYDKKMSILA